MPTHTEKRIHEKRTRLLGGLGLTVSLVALLGGCRTSGPDHIPTESARAEQLALMLPDRIVIEPFTRIRSFDDDPVPDGILAVVRPVDPFGDPVKAAGRFYFELYHYRDASPDRRGPRLEFWEIEIDSVRKVREHWSRAQMYEFRLAWTRGAGQVRVGQRYLLVVTYRTPWDTTLQAEKMIEFHRPGEFLPEPSLAEPAS